MFSGTATNCTGYNSFGFGDTLTGTLYNCHESNANAFTAPTGSGAIYNSTTANGAVFTTGDVTISGALKSKAHFIAASSDTITISDDIDDPTLIADFTMLDSYGFTLRASDGAIQNTSGRDLDGVVGNVAIQTVITGGTKTLNFWSEVSADGITFTPIANSLRQLEIANLNESFNSTVSFTPSWSSDSYVRFKFATSADDMSFSAPSITSDGTTISGRSIVWELTEQ
jgi:hypothetical protein